MAKNPEMQPISKYSTRLLVARGVPFFFFAAPKDDLLQPWVLS
jgi:hypothetical protein